MSLNNNEEPEVDEETSFLRSLQGEQEQVFSKVSPLADELIRFIPAMKQAVWDGVDTLKFLASIADTMPILARIAARFVPANSCSSDVERLFTRSGHIVSPARTGLLQSTVNMLTSLNYWCTEEEGALIRDYFDGSRFATLENETNIVLSGVDTNESDSEDECDD